MASTGKTDNADPPMESPPRHGRHRSNFVFDSISRSSRNLISGLGEVGRLLSGRNLNEGWTCECCTYQNENTEFLSCEICGSIRRAPSDLMIDDDDLEEQDSRFATASAEQERTLKEVREGMEEKEHQALVERRMQEIIDRQRELYDQIENKKVSRSSITVLLQTQKSIKMLQELLACDSTDNEAQSFPPSFTPLTPQRKPAPGCSPQSQPTRRSIRLAQDIENPVKNMKSNPWEQKETGIQDILNVQSELWDQVKDPKEGRKRHLFRRRLNTKT